jgi:hypothetical protein
MPLKLSANVRDQWGEPAAGRASWKVAQGATVTSDGVFTASRPGEYTVTATAGDKSDEVTVHVAGSGWIERFDDQWADGWRLTAEDAGDASLTARWWKLHVKSDRATLAVYEPGVAWKDYSFVADLVVEKQHFTVAPTRGVVFRYQDPHHHYRFERAEVRGEAGQQTTVCRLVKVVDGQESELARSGNVPPPLVLTGQQWDKYPSHYVPGKDYFKPRVEQGTIERYNIEVRGPAIVCKLNDKPCISVQDDGAGQGTVGICCAGGGSGVLFDNLEARPSR